MLFTRSITAAAVQVSLPTEQGGKEVRSAQANSCHYRPSVLSSIRVNLGGIPLLPPSTDLADHLGQRLRALLLDPPPAEISSMARSTTRAHRSRRLHRAHHTRYEHLRVYHARLDKSRLYTRSTIPSPTHSSTTPSPPRSSTPHTERRTQAVGPTANGEKFCSTGQIAAL